VFLLSYIARDCMMINRGFETGIDGQQYKVEVAYTKWIIGCGIIREKTAAWAVMVLGVVFPLIFVNLGEGKDRFMYRQGYTRLYLQFLAVLPPTKYYFTSDWDSRIE